MIRMTRDTNNLKTWLRLSNMQFFFKITQHNLQEDILMGANITFAIRQFPKPISQTLGTTHACSMGT